MAMGQLADALSQFHSAIGRHSDDVLLSSWIIAGRLLESDPKNYIAYFRRATVYLAMGKAKAALPDLSKVIALKPDFTAVRITRCSPI